jgi:UDP-2,3-diacylglucosamine hydrolase
VQKESPKSIFFISDLHLGAPNEDESMYREKKVISFLNQIEGEVAELFLVGDVFDFWYEYHTAIPKGFTRFMAKIAEWTDKGIPVHFFTGNHDMWTFGYLEKELGIILHKAPIVIERNGKHLMIGHGDGLGPGDRKFKLWKGIFNFPFFQKLFGWIHPDIGIWIAHKWSRSSRKTQSKPVFIGKEKEWLYIYATEEKLKNPKIDCFIFGHRHLALDLKIEGSDARYINLGDWINIFSYATLINDKIELHEYKF